MVHGLLLLGTESPLTMGGIQYPICVASRSNQGDEERYGCRLYAKRVRSSVNRQRHQWRSTSYSLACALGSKRDTHHTMDNCMFSKQNNFPRCRHKPMWMSRFPTLTNTSSPPINTNTCPPRINDAQPVLINKQFTRPLIVIPYWCKRSVSQWCPWFTSDRCIRFDERR